jgi:superfamily II DNA or RNA helicase
VHKSDRLIASCKSWSEFWDRARNLPSYEKGSAFERLTQLYLQTAPEYQAELKHVWLLPDVPPAIARRLNLPSVDEGIDLIGVTRHGEYWAFQSKFRERDQALTRRELGTFTSLAFNTCSNIALAVVAHTCSKPISKRHLMRDTTEIGLDRWQALDHEAWGLIVAKLHGKSQKPKPRAPKHHQAQAISAAEQHFVSDRATRGRLLMPCGTGKSLTAYWIAEALEAKRILVAVPSLALVRQGLTEWTREFLARGVKPDWLCVCSDESVGDLESDTFVGEVYDLGVPAHTDIGKIAAFLGVRSSDPKIVFTTYQSSANLAAAARKARVSFDLAILDEAHKTVGKHSKTFATLLSDKKISIQRRLFMTATERMPRDSNEAVLSMDSEKDYGRRFFQLSFKQAIKEGIIADYRVLTLTVSDRRIRNLIDENRILDLNSRNLDEAEAQSLAAGIALKRVYNKHGIKHAISFHRSIRAADRFREQQDALNRPVGPRVQNFHISSKKTAGQRSRLLREFVDAKRALMTNARCLTEGVDVPAIDCVMFADPKQSRIDIVQAAGRALRNYPGKQFGYIVVPVVVPSGMDFETFAETTAYRQVAQTITALSIQDERIAEEFRLIEAGRISKGKIVEIDGDVPVGMRMALGDFAEAISTRVWESVGRANWRPFEEARAFARNLGLQSHVEWWKWTSGKLRRRELIKKPPDIPATPEWVYAGKWIDWADWLGHTRRVGKWRAFSAAREFARGLHLSSRQDWLVLVNERKNGKSNCLPDDIPSVPENVYEEWVGWWDWLGTRHRRGGWLPFAKARTISRSLGLQNQAQFTKWRQGKLNHSVFPPVDMPLRPARVYADFKGWPDFLNYTPREWMPCDEAKKLVQRLGIRSQQEYHDWIAGRTRRRGLPKRPRNIPANPDQIYADEWAGFNDFLGTAVPRNIRPQWRPFNLAREFVRSQNLGSYAEFCEWKAGRLKSKPNFPSDIPADPYTVYGKDPGWKGASDFLGIKQSARYVKMWSFKKARSFVRSLKLESKTQFSKWASGEYPDLPEKPLEVPVVPFSKYSAEWRGWDDWLGNGKADEQR